ncbi:MAG: ABC transporter ATP-binding protein [Candidatus Baldrarchaeia archaeon]
MKEAVIKVEGLVKFYGKIRALAGVTFEVEHGTCFGYLGPNGAGKTTTIRILLGLIKQDAGRAFILGEKAGSRKALRRVGYLPERPGFYDHWTLLDYMRYIGTLYGMALREAKRRAEELLEWIKLGDWAYEKIGNLSAGMRQRLAFAQAFINDPDLLILDEPTSNLDPMARIEILDKIKSAVREGRTVLFSSHVLPEVERVSDHIVIIHRGLILAQGRIEDLRRLPNTYSIKTDNPQILVNELKNLSYVKNVSIKDRETLFVEVEDVSRFEGEIARIIAKCGVKLKRFEPVGESLENIYVRIVREGGIPVGGQR